MAEADDLAQWERDCVLELSASHENEVFLKLVLLASLLGYERVSFGMEVPKSMGEPVFTYWSNYPDDWSGKFVERKVRHHGAHVGYGKRLSPPAPGRSEYFWSRCDFQREADAYGIAFDYQATMLGKNGTLALIGLSRPASLLSEFDKKRLTILVNATVDAMATLLLDKHLPGHRVQITATERQYMCWVLDGKTASEIASIMNIPPTKVEAMQRSLPGRFEKKGIFATAFLAFRLDMLDPDAECLPDDAPPGSNPDPAAPG